MKKRLGALVLMLSLSIGTLAALPAGAQSLASFAKDEHYLGQGGTPPSLQSFAATPQTYLRSPGAHAALASHLGVATEQLPTALQGLVTEPCDGRQIETAGITAAGGVNWTTRKCYRGEELIVRISPSGERQVVASLGCLNPVRRVIAVPRASTPPPRTSWGVMNTPPRIVTVPDLNVCGCYTLPGHTSIMPGSQMRPADW